MRMLVSSQLGGRLAIGGSADIFAWGDRHVIKRFRRGTPAAAATREAAYTRSVRAAGAPAPETFEVVEVDGDSGVIFERVDGHSMLEALLAGAQNPASVGRSLAQLHVQLHALSSAQLPEQRARLLEALARAPVDEQERQTITDRLGRLPAGDRICHGDFHPGNVLLAPNGPIVIDWYDAAHGSPVADVAQTCLLLLHAQPPGVLTAAVHGQIERLRADVHDAYLMQYRELNRIDERELADWRLVMAAARLGHAPSASERTTLTTVIRDHLRGLHARRE